MKLASWVVQDPHQVKVSPQGHRRERLTVSIAAALKWSILSQLRLRLTLLGFSSLFSGTFCTVFLILIFVCCKFYLSNEQFVNEAQSVEEAVSAEMSHSQGRFCSFSSSSCCCWCLTGWECVVKDVMKLDGSHVGGMLQMGAYHTLDLEMNRPFTLSKQEWDSVTLERIGCVYMGACMFVCVQEICGVQCKYKWSPLPGIESYQGSHFQVLVQVRI